jgi:hypothetical protein
VLRNRPDEYHEGQAVAARESHRPDSLDLFLDWRININSISMPPFMQDPHSVPSFLTTARAFALKHPKARFSILRLWSAPHFYPLMIGPENHDATSFRDLTGRRFIWMFVPKDMACSEWSIHKTARDRIEPFKKFFGDRISIKRDAFLVMGEDEKDLFRLTAAATFAIQMRPWRWEVDLWKSFVNVDMEFLKDLDERWMV